MNNPYIVINVYKIEKSNVETIEKKLEDGFESKLDKVED